MRAAQSKGIIDLLALWPVPIGYTNGTRRPWLVQCKHSIKGGGFLAASEAELLRDLAERTGAVPVLARPKKGGRGIEFINLNTEEPLG